MSITAEFTSRRCRVWRVQAGAFFVLISTIVAGVSMPAFQAPEGSGYKRKSDESELEATRKRQALGDKGSSGGEQYWMVQWCVSLALLTKTVKSLCRRFPQNRKHKTWEGDAVLVTSNGGASGVLYDLEGKR